VSYCINGTCTVNSVLITDQATKLPSDDDSDQRVQWAPQQMLTSVQLVLPIAAAALCHCDFASLNHSSPNTTPNLGKSFESHVDSSRVTDAIKLCCDVSRVSNDDGSHTNLPTEHTTIRESRNMLFQGSDRPSIFQRLKRVALDRLLHIRSSSERSG
jgi:hypothetical protein